MQKFWKIARRLTVVIVGVILTAQISYLSTKLYKELFKLSVASTDNVQFLISQLEVESLKFKLALIAVEDGQDRQLTNLRERFDILYSRISLTSSGYVKDILKREEETRLIGQLTLFAQETATLIDGPDDGVIASLDMLRSDIETVQVQSRKLAVLTVQRLGEIETRKQQTAGGLIDEVAGIAIFELIFFLITFAIITILYFIAQKNAADVLEASSRQRAILAATLDVVLVLNKDGQIVETGGSVETILGRVPAEILGSAVSKFLRLEENDKAFTGRFADLTTLETGQPGNAKKTKMWVSRQDGQTFPANISVVQTSIGDNPQYVMFITDESEVYNSRKGLLSALAKAKDAELEKSRFIAVMNHEMRTPLNGIIGGVELLRKTRPNDSQKRFLDIIWNSSERLLAQVNRILDITRIESGKVQVAPGWFNAQALFDQQIQIVSHLAEQRGNRIFFSGTTKPWTYLWTDFEILRHVVMNLLSNAIKFTKNGTIELCVTASPESETLQIEVHDTGTGIKPENLEAVFEDFYSIDGQAGRYHEGAGLGLGIARRLVGALKGTISVESEFGQGTTFTVTLPVKGRSSAPDRQETDRKRAQPMPDNPPLNILVVEDDQINREVMGAYLSDQGHKATFAIDGPTCLETLKSADFDVVFLDFFLPGMEGPEIAQEIRKAYPNFAAKIVGFTADTSKTLRHRAEAAGIADILYKPFRPDDLARFLAGVMARDKAAPSGDSQKLVSEIAKADGQGKQAEIRQRLGDEKFTKLRTLLFQEASDLSQMMTNNLAKAEFGEIAQAAHRLTGSAGFMGFTSLEAVCRDIEASAKSEDKAALHDRLAQLDHFLGATGSQ
jgi:PAS domain S-box-containing protein